MPQSMLGISLILLAGVMAGDCMLPLKFNRSWHWENTWFVFSLASLVFLPWLLALVLVDHLFAAYATLGWWQLALPFLLGAGWGIAQVLFGLSVQRLGLGLAYAIIIGLGTMLGTLVPMFVQHRAQLNPAILLDVFCGIAVMIVGIALSAWAGKQREYAQPSQSHVLAGARYVPAVMMAVVCGLLAPMLNYSFAFGEPIARAAQHLGNSPARSAYAVWPVGLAGGLLPNLGYSIHLLRKRKTAALFQNWMPEVYWALMMAVLWMGAVALYGMSAAYLGTFGTSIGWGLFQIFMIITATVSGIFTGEWRGAPRQAVTLLSISLLLLISATGLLVMANHPQ